MSMKIVQFISEVILLICFLVLHGMPSAHADNPCEDNIYLEVGTEGVVPCDFGDFELLGWINGNGNHEETSPFIYWENSQVKGSGSRDYDMLPNGSLVIKNVQVRNNRDYTALYVPFVGPQLYFKVPVRVFALPDPEYPVINGFSRQQYIVQDVGTSGSINCTLNGGRPGVPLEWDYQSDAISMENVSLSNRSNSDGSTNTLLTSRFTITSQSVKRVMLKCKTAGDLAYLFPLVTTIYLHVKRNYPIVNGQTSQHHVVVVLRQEDELNCSLNGVPQEIFLQWVMLSTEQSDGLLINNETSKISNGDGTVNITLTSSFNIVSPSVQHKILQCIAIGQGSDLYPDVTTVDILFTKNYPIVNGHANLHHVVIELKKEDELNCSMSRVPQGVLLQWVLLTEEPSGELMLQNETSTVHNEDGTANITLTSRFSVLSPSIRRITLQCRVSGQEADRYLDFTTVDVLILNSFPVVNGHVGRQHVVLHLNRVDELNCSLNGVSQGVSLEWVIITPDASEEFLLEDKHSKTTNEDGTCDVRLYSRLTVHSHSLEHVTMECRASSQMTDQYKEVTTVEILITESFPVVNGHVGRQHVVLHLNRVDELNCSLNGVSQGVSLEWVIITPDASEEFLLEDKHSKTTNEDGTCDVRLYSRLTVHSHSLEHVTMECRASSQMTDQYKEVTTVEILITESFPVVNGHVGRQHVVLHLNRVDELNCSLNGVSQGVSLEWVIITPDASEEFLLEDKHSKTTNEDGTCDVRLYSRLTVHSHSLEHVTIECRASSHMTDQYKEVTTVEILITEKPDVGPLPLPVIDGCYSQQEYCSLTLPRDGALTCSVMHVPPEYTVDRRLNMFANAEGLSLTIINDDHLPDVSGAFDLITRYHYTVDEDTAQSLICCSLSVIHNNKLLNSSTTSLIKWQGTENSSTGISISTLTVVIAVFVVVLALTFLTAITHKRVKRSQKRIVWLCSLQDVERNGDVSLNTRHGNGHIPNSDAHAHEVLPLRGRKEDGHFISEIEVSPL